MTPPQVAEAVFDSHRFVKRLTEAGMERGLAEVLADEHMCPWIRNVATKTDLANCEANVRREVATKTDLANCESNVRSDVKADVGLVRKDLAKTEANIRNNAAAKTDLAAVREDLAGFRAETASKTDLEHAVEVARLDLEKRIAELRGDLIKWMFGALMAQGALVVAIIKLFS